MQYDKTRACSCLTVRCHIMHGGPLGRCGCDVDNVVWQRILCIKTPLQRRQQVAGHTPFHLRPKDLQGYG
jgi:hypothetical protein